MSKKLVIRINNLKDSEISDSYEVSEETVIRWDRVIRVSVFAALLLIALIWSGWYFFQDRKPNSEEAYVEALTEAPVSSVETQALVNQETEAKPIESLAIEEPVSTKESTQEKIDTEAPISAQVDQAETKERVEPVEEPLPTVLSEVSIETSASAAELAPAVELGPVVQLASEPEALQPEASIVFFDPIVIESKKIVKAQLTHAVNKSEPVDRLGNTISMNEDTLIKVYLYTGMEGLKGETLYHDWYLAGKKMARVKINVRKNKTSASSSKFIDQYMTGDWRVKVTTSGGDELVSAQFNVTP